MPDTLEELTPYQQAVYDSVYEGLIDQTDEADAQAQALETARQTDPVPPSRMGTRLGLHRGGPATFFGNRAPMRPGEIIGFPPVPAGPSPALAMARPPLEPPPEPIPPDVGTRAADLPAPVGPPVPPPRELRTFTATNPPRPPGADTADVIESLRTQINALKFKDAKDALNAATQFQATRAYQNFLAQGGTEAEGLKRYGRLMFYAQPGVLPGMIRETTPVQVPKTVDAGQGVRVVTGGRGGAQFRVVPQNALPQAPFQIEEVELGGETYIHVSPKSYIRKDKVRDAPAGVQASIYKAQIERAEKDIRTIPFEKTNPTIPKEELPDLDKTRPERLKAAKQRLKEAIDNQESLLRTAPRKAAPAATAAPGAVATPKSKAEYDALPSGTRYLDPNGVERVKG